MKKKVLLSSILTVVLCLCLIAGSTFALFTSQKELDVEVTSGKVSIDASINNLQLWSVVPDAAGTVVDEYNQTYTYADQTLNGKFLNTGTAAVQSNLLSLDRVTPGDKVSFTVNTANDSNVNIYVRYSIKLIGTESYLAHGLVLNVNGTEYESVASYTSGWTPIAVGGTLDPVYFELGLPVDAGNVYQNGYAQYAILVEAVQGNAALEAFGPSEITYVEKNVINTEADLKNAIANGGEYILDGNIELTNKLTVNAGTDVAIDLNGYTISGTFNHSNNQEMFLVKGNLSIENGNINMVSENNQGWSYMATIFDVTAGGALVLDGVQARNFGTDMNFIVHLNNWGDASVAINNCEFDLSYVAVRAFNSGSDMNNVTIENTNVNGGARLFWVHNYTNEGKNDSTLNLDIYNNNNTCDNAKPVRFGFSGSVYYDLNGNQILN